MLNPNYYSSSPSNMNYSSLQSYMSPPVAPEMFSAAAPATNWMEGFGTKATGGFSGAGLTPAAEPGMFGGMFDGFFGGKDAAGAKTGGWGMDLVGAGSGLLSALSSWKANKRADEAFKYQKMITDKNMANQTASYNSNMTNKKQDSQSGNQNIDDYVNKNRLA
jgi:hypothetical protein